jgi:hypothetical protein
MGAAELHFFGMHLEMRKMRGLDDLSQSFFKNKK